MNILIFNKTISEHPLFRDKSDVERFESLLAMVNSNIQLQAGWWKTDKWKTSKAMRIVNIHAYNFSKHYLYLLIHVDDIRDKTRFILRLKTAYTMYYNRKYAHKGPIFQAKHKKRNISDENIDSAMKFINNKPPKLVDIRDVDELIEASR